MSRKLTQEEFLARASIIHDNFYDYSEVVYVSSGVKVKIICPVHGEFHQIPSGHLDGKGCKLCGFVSTAAQRSSNTLEFVEKAKALHGDRYDYSKVDYKRAYQKVSIICKEHGEFSTVPNSHLNGSGCPLCASISLGISQRKSQEDFVKESSVVHKGKYDYSETKYTTKDNLVDIICPHHGKFRQQANNHLAGSGCPSCAKGGYSPTKSGWIYILQFDNIFKIGITNKKPSLRARRINKSSGKKFKVITAICFEDGRIPDFVETILLRELRARYKQPSDKFEGSSECFYDVCYTSLLHRIGIVASETFSKLNN